MASTPPTTFPNWPKLPIELKLQILSHVLHHSKPFYYTPPGIDNKDAYAHIPQDLDSIIATRNCDLVTCALEAYYKSNSFRIEMGCPTAIFPAIAYQKPRFATWIQSVQLRVMSCHVVDSLGGLLANPHAGWRWLLRPKREMRYQDIDPSSTSFVMHPKPQRYTAWQEGFAQVKKLDLMVSIVEKAKWGTPLLNCEGVRGLKYCLEDAEVMVKAETISVTVSVLGHALPDVKCICEREIEVVLWAMVKST